MKWKWNWKATVLSALLAGAAVAQPANDPPAPKPPKDVYNALLREVINAAVSSKENEDKWLESARAEVTHADADRAHPRFRLDMAFKFKSTVWSPRLPSEFKLVFDAHGTPEKDKDGKEVLIPASSAPGARQVPSAISQGELDLTFSTDTLSLFNAAAVRIASGYCRPEHVDQREASVTRAKRLIAEAQEKLKNAKTEQEKKFAQYSLQSAQWTLKSAEKTKAEADVACPALRGISSAQSLAEVAAAAAPLRAWLIKEATENPYSRDYKNVKWGAPALSGRGEAEKLTLVDTYTPDQRVLGAGSDLTISRTELRWKLHGRFRHPKSDLESFAAFVALGANFAEPALTGEGLKQTTRFAVHAFKHFRAFMLTGDEKELDKLFRGPGRDEKISLPTVNPSVT